MTLSQTGQFIRRWLWLCLVGTLLAAASSYLVTIRLPKLYEASAKLLVTPGSGSAGSVDYNVVLTGQALTRTYAELAKTRPVVESAIQAGQLGLGYEDAVAALDAAPVRDTQLVQVTARGSHPDEAAALANLVATALVQQAQSTQSSRFSASKDTLSKQLNQLSADLTQRTNQVGALRAEPASPERDAQLARVEFELTQLQQTYATVTRSYDDVRLAEARSTDVLSVVEPAALPVTPVQPRVLVNVLLAAIVGLLLAVGVAFLADTVDDRLASRKRVERFTGLTLLGAIGQRQAQAPVTVDQVSEPALSSSNRYHASRAGESFRLLSANLQVASLDRPLRTLMVTSAGAGEGKSNTAANLAIVIAQAGRSVVLVDADLHAPSLHEVLGVQNHAGLSSLLLHDHLVSASALMPSRVDGLWLLPSGPLPADPSELLASQRMRHRLAELCQLADLVILDSAPVLATSDPTVLASLVDGVVLVANAQSTRGRDAAEAVAILQNAGARLLGVVLNRVPHQGASRYPAYAEAHEAQLRPTAP